MRSEQIVSLLSLQTGCCMNSHILSVVGQSLFQNTALSAGEGNGNSFKEGKRTRQKLLQEAL